MEFWNSPPNRMTKTAPHGTPLQYSCPENPMDRGAWKAAVHKVAEGRTRLSDFTFTFHFHALAKDVAAHSSVLAWRIPGTGEPGGLPSMGSHRVGHDWSDLAAKYTINAVCLNHLETTPPCLSPWKNYLPENWSLVPKSVGHHCPTESCVDEARSPSWGRTAIAA